MNYLLPLISGLEHISQTCTVHFGLTCSMAIITINIIRRNKTEKKLCSNEQR